MKILIVYYTKTGHTLEAAEAVAEGVRQGGGEVELVSVRDFEPAALESSGAVILGSPCWGGALSAKDCTAKPMAKLLKSLAADALADKRCGGIAVHSRSGGQNTVDELGRLAAEKGCADFRPGPAARAGVPLSLWKGAAVKPEDLALFREYGLGFTA